MATIPTNLHTTDDLIKYYHAAEGSLPDRWAELAIPVAIDAVYAARDAGASMHGAGATAAIAALLAIKDYR